MVPKGIRNLIGNAKGYGKCLKCGDSWYWKKGHSTVYDVRDDGSTGCFPLCEECWAGLTPEERLPYYLRMYSVWGGEDKWSKIKKAVLEGR